MATVILLGMPVVSLYGGGPVEYVGKLDAKLRPNRDGLGAYLLSPTSTLERAKYSIPFSAMDSVYCAKLDLPNRDRRGLQIVLVETDDGRRMLYADTNLDGKIEASELVSLSRNPRGDVWDAVLNLPLVFGPYHDYPVVIGLYDWDPRSNSNDRRSILYSDTVFVRGWVEIKGRKTLVQYEFDPSERAINLANLSLGVDTDGDGEIDMDHGSPENAFGHGEDPVIFRVGDWYVSTKFVDLATGRIVMRSHAASEYKRVELRAGEDVADFPFTDLEGKHRKLSDFRGKYVLLDFWFTSCGPCLAEIPVLKEAYEKYRSQGFEILGLSSDEDDKDLRRLCRERGLTWPQALPGSVADVVQNRFRITNWPTVILLDKEGKILSWNRKLPLPLQGEALLTTLEKVFRAN